MARKVYTIVTVREFDLVPPKHERVEGSTRWSAKKMRLKSFFME